MLLLLLKSPRPFKLQFLVVCSGTRYKQCRLVCLQSVWLLLQRLAEERDEKTWVLSSHIQRRCANSSYCYFTVTASRVKVVHWSHFYTSCPLICLSAEFAQPSVCVFPQQGLFLKLPPQNQPTDKLLVVSAGSLCNNTASRICKVDAVLPCLQAGIWLFMAVYMSIRWDSTFCSMVNAAEVWSLRTTRGDGGQ